MNLNKNYKDGDGDYGLLVGKRNILFFPNLKDTK